MGPGTNPQAHRPPPNLASVLLCQFCNRPVEFNDGGQRQCCDDPLGAVWKDGILIYDQNLPSDLDRQIAIRDEHAAGYLTHSKFPTQISRLEQFLSALPRPGALPVLDLGCGAGPTTQMLVGRGFKVIAVDFSLESLRLNRKSSGPDAVFVRADLNRLRIQKTSVEGLMMADFLQHLGEEPVQRAFLSKAFEALVPGGWFYLSFFNFNVKNFLRGDRRGAFAGGATPYVRLRPRQGLRMLPEDVEVERVLPMNIFHGARLDRIASGLPFGSYFSRMTQIFGKKKK